MRIPSIRFCGDDRPIEPWEDYFAPIVLPLAFVVIIMMSAVGVCLILGWAIVSPVLPRSWRLDWDTSFELDPSHEADCPACHAKLSLGVVNKRGDVVRTDQGREFARPDQSATCPRCRRAFRRASCGKVWSAWHEVQQ